MVDTNSATSQFHPYQPSTAEPQSQKTSGGLGGLLKTLGMGGLNGSLQKMGNTNIDVRGGVEKARTYARSNPGMVLGGLAAAVIGAGLMARRGRGNVQ